ncbi:hypothetical protein IHE45_06G054300 [Dioscorea alata]|uniref:Uncharacterized protein n=1 Tax=Dioscorea alata TaxID=55571 RepID=A0ACB7VXR4_DIOAL|nr:hypothetical protein IHE45_06G054300 [Dioscorea alata]
MKLVRCCTALGNMHLVSIYENHPGASSLSEFPSFLALNLVSSKKEVCSCQ